MKKILLMCVAVFVILLSACSQKKDDELVGKWCDNTTGQVVEYTADGYYYEYINESFTFDKTSYKANGEKITYYIEGEEDSEFSVKYSVEDKILTIEDTLTYTFMGKGKEEK